jgi:hypothetical protein
MKCKTLIFTTLSLSFFLLYLPAQAQVTKSESGVNAAKSVSTPIYCDEIMERMEKELQKQANDECRTVEACIECISRHSNGTVYMFLYVQPNVKTCKPVEIFPPSTAALSRGEGKPDNTFRVEVKQSICTRSGSSLEVVIPGHDLDCEGDDFNFIWEVDGKRSGTERSIDCACGKEALIRVTQISTGVTVRRNIRLNSCSGKVDDK